MLMVVVALGPFAMSSFIPSLKPIKDDFGVGIADVQWALSLSMLSIAVMTLVYGPLSDRFGRRPVLIGAIALGVIGSLLGAFAYRLDMVIAGRIFQAAGTASGIVLARAMVQDIYGPERMTSVLGNVSAAMIVAPMIGPIIGGYLNGELGWRANFGLIAVIATVVWFSALFRLPETNFRKKQTISLSGTLRDFGSLLTNRPYMRYSLFGVFAQTGFMSFLAGASYILGDVYGIPDAYYGFYFLPMPIGFMAGSLTAGRLGRTWDNIRIIRMGSIVTVAAFPLAIYAAFGGFASILWLIIPLAVSAFGNGLAMPAAQSGSVSAAPTIAGSASGLYGFLQMTFSAIMAQFIGLVQGTESAMPTVLSMAVLMTMAPVIFFGLIKPAPAAVR